MKTVAQRYAPMVISALLTLMITLVVLAIGWWASSSYNENVDAIVQQLVHEKQTLEREVEVLNDRLVRQTLRCLRQVQRQLN